MEVFGDDIDFFLGFSWERRGRQNLVDCNRDRFRNVLLIAIILRDCFQSKFRSNLSSESISFIISIKSVLLWNTWDLTFYFSFIYFSFDFIFLFLFLLG